MSDLPPSTRKPKSSAPVHCSAEALPIRIQRKRTPGWRLPPNTVIVTRGSKWGNPFKVPADGTAGECIAKFRELIYEGCVFRSECDVIEDLRGKNLACWCPLGSPCHADVLLEIANQAND